jgi:hypothetical protein
MKKTMVISAAAAGMFAVMCSMSVLSGAQATKPVKPLRVGVYDSRSIAMACLRSQWWNDLMQEKMKELDKAKAAGDEKKIKELNEWGESNQAKAHLQGFGTAPVKNLLERIKDQLPGVAQQAGVDIIVSKWQIDYQVKDAELVDVTDAIVALYKPSEETLKILEEVKKQPPVSEEELSNMKD